MYSTANKWLSRCYLQCSDYAHMFVKYWARLLEIRQHLLRYTVYVASWKPDHISLITILLSSVHVWKLVTQTAEQLSSNHDSPLVWHYAAPVGVGGWDGVKAKVFRASYPTQCGCCFILGVRSPKHLSVRFGFLLNEVPLRDGESAGGVRWPSLCCSSVTGRSEPRSKPSGALSQDERGRPCHTGPDVAVGWHSCPRWGWRLIKGQSSGREAENEVSQLLCNAVVFKFERKKEKKLCKWENHGNVLIICI